MIQKDLFKIKRLLIKSRRDKLRQFCHLEALKEELRQPSIEPVDEAQKEVLARLVHKFIERDKEEIEEIDRAIDKIDSDRYGRCELCDKSIPFKRLKVVPATRLCRNCAQKYEDALKLRKHQRDEIIGEELLNEYRNISKESLHNIH